MSRPSARYVLPEFTERTNFGERRLDPYSKLFENRVVFLGTPLDEAAASDVITQFMHLEHLDPDRDITLYLNCPGGSFHAMTAIYDTMQYVTCEVQTYCLGQAASVGAVLLAAGTPGKRFTLPGARVVLSQPELPEPAQGQPSDLLIQADELVRLRTLMEEMLVRHTGRTEEQVHQDLERDLMLDAPGALSYGLVDGVVPSRRDLPGER
ncbi:ATP-dependent Clp protease proteolytic subunit [Streptomyces griseofuscus]|uniref:ATP-dependent Clp protease proteolytic subunit n=1 Tax=Streptomyces griseofuscus TaxID=146922 RepID=A0A7H1Q934_9ACTN|nr:MULTISPECIES: ATP-dependent Clp protease proteolytic subunit [Streptomyces]BBC97404.1 ATP-dependent Clp protease proteolytic subunit [Streptomyces rochei]MBA9044499.1 ATP-dependent Clp protease protease subunit [Streptomyces murinus]MBJ6999751.1 ATP-dependent Clp protease proteolytic subunit [Streptomyces sp. CRPSP2-6A1]MYR84726.1 ATP-dependent Clp protease proteolytic subunit [Streptomyces sp. SID685]QNT96814.1 ATP-dependent Clp protease proteolytic subunit [Streptomyces griseofuscus]